MGESQQGGPTQGAKDPEGAHNGHAVTPVLVDGHPAEGNGAAITGQEVVAGDKPAEVKDGGSHPSPQPTQQPAEVTIPEQQQQQPDKSTSTKVDQGVSQSVANGNGHDTNTASKKPPLIGPFVPVNAHETLAIKGGAQDNSSGAVGNEISTHKPLAPVSKLPRLPSEAAVDVPQAAEGKVAGDEQAPKGGAEDGALAPHTGANGDSSAGARPHSHEGEPPAGLCVGEEAKAAAEPPQSGCHGSKEAPQTEETTPTGGTTHTKEPVPSRPAPVPASLGAKPAEKSPSAPASPTKPRFPRFSRDSSSSEPPHFGLPRRRKSTIIEKIKHIFSHEKQKGEKHKK